MNTSSLSVISIKRVFDILEQEDKRDIYEYILNQSHSFYIDNFIPIHIFADSYEKAVYQLSKHDKFREFYTNNQGKREWISYIKFHQGEPGYIRACIFCHKTKDRCKREACEQYQINDDTWLKVAISMIKNFDISWKKE